MQMRIRTPLNACKKFLDPGQGMSIVTDHDRLSTFIGGHGMPSSDQSTSFCAWEQSYCVGIQALDDQHKGLFSTLNNFYDILMSHGDPTLMDKELSSLLQQTRAHCKTEEAYMLEHGYPGYQIHKKMHELLLHQLEDVLILESGSYDQPWVARLETADFLHTWLVAHILNEDKKLGAFLSIDDVE